MFPKGKMPLDSTLCFLIVFCIACQAHFNVALRYTDDEDNFGDYP